MIGKDPTSQGERVALRIIPGGYAMMLIQWDNAVAPVWIASTNLIVLATAEKEETR